MVYNLYSKNNNFPKSHDANKEKISTKDESSLPSFWYFTFGKRITIPTLLEEINTPILSVRLYSPVWQNLIGKLDQGMS